MQDLILAIEASTSEASVALIADDALIAQELVPSHDASTGLRSEGLLPVIAKSLHAAQCEPRDLASVVCSAGPGGFTSLRSAASVAKGLCSALRIPLYAISTMEILIAGAQLPTGWYVTALEAGRGEYYASTVRLVDERLTEVSPVTIVANERLQDLAHEMHATLVGPHLEIDVIPRAAFMLPLLDQLFATGPVDLDTWEPMYGRLAEAQVKWEATHGRPLVT